MAPLLHFGLQATESSSSIQGSIQWRGLGDDLLDFSPRQLWDLKLTALVVAPISVASALVALFWFTRMKRSYRHEYVLCSPDHWSLLTLLSLIMLLILSDMFKAIWFLIYPIVEMVHGDVSSRSAFCQVSGFFLTMAIEASDVAVVLVALHTALYIFRGRNGLYPHRYIAYGVYICLPLFLAGLAFIEDPAFVNTGEFCYLPISPDWSRRALSWIPRYAIFIKTFH